MWDGFHPSGTSVPPDQNSDAKVGHNGDQCEEWKEHPRAHALYDRAGVGGANVELVVASRTLPLTVDLNGQARGVTHEVKRHGPSFTRRGTDVTADVGCLDEKVGAATT